jgi:alkylation response protein AidB-like acyl-CoA dehydrogenase
VDTLVRALLAATPPGTDDLVMWRLATDSARGGFATTIDRALVGGAHADRLGFAFAAGYAEALRALVPSATDVMALCATEDGGNQPRAIKTTLTRRDGVHVITGKKKWATGASAAASLLVVASVGTADAVAQAPSGTAPAAGTAPATAAGTAPATGTAATGRNLLRVVKVSTAAPGLRITPTSAPFVPEIPHAEVELDHVPVADADILPGDGYDDYLKPFRTVEDVHVHAALAGYLIGVARRRGWHDLVERWLAVALAARSVALIDAKAPTTHVALAGVLTLATREVEEIEARWRAQVDDPEHARWQRDRPLLQVAMAARTARRDRAWQQLG